MIKRFGQYVRPTRNGSFFYIFFLSCLGMSPGPHLEGMHCPEGPHGFTPRTTSRLGSWAGDHMPFPCRCGAEEHVEAVKKLQNSAKLLQKVTYSAEDGEGSPGVGSPDPTPPPSRLCSSSERGGRGERSGGRMATRVLLLLSAE